MEASVLIVGARNPIRLKVEITHLWGRPLVHILIRENRIHLISFSEKRYYAGAMGEPFISDLLPMHLDPRLLWAVGRGFPILYEYHHAASPEGNQITLLNREQTVVQRIDFYPESDLPQQAFYPDIGLEISFSDFKNHNHIPFAQKTRLSNHDNETTLRIENKQMVFNRIIADGVFNLAVPPGFTRWHDDPRLDTP